MSDDERRILSARQDAIVRALIAGDAIPEGFDPEAIERARALLAHKQAWVDARRAKHARPSALVRALRSLLRWA